MQAIRFDPPGGGLAFAGRAAPLACAALGVGAGESPLAMLTSGRGRLAGVASLLFARGNLHPLPDGKEGVEGFRRIAETGSASTYLVEYQRGRRDSNPRCLDGTGLTIRCVRPLRHAPMCESGRGRACKFVPRPLSIDRALGYSSAQQYSGRRDDLSVATPYVWGAVRLSRQRWAGPLLPISRFCPPGHFQQVRFGRTALVAVLASADALYLVVLAVEPVKGRFCRLAGVQRYRPCRQTYNPALQAG